MYYTILSDISSDAIWSFVEGVDDLVYQALSICFSGIHNQYNYAHTNQYICIEYWCFVRFGGMRKLYLRKNGFGMIYNARKGIPYGG